MLTPRTRLLIAFFASAPVLLAVFWLVQKGFRGVALGLFLLLFAVDFLLLRPRLGSTGTVRLATQVPARSVWVVATACFLGSVSLLANGVSAHDKWEIAVATFGMLASAWGIASFARR